PNTLVHGAWGSVGNVTAGPFRNLHLQGTVDADTAGSTVTLQNETIFDEGAWKAENGGTLTIGSSNWSAAAGTIQVNPAAANPSPALSPGGSFSTGSRAGLTRNGGTAPLPGPLDNTGQTVALNNTTGTWLLDSGAQITGGTLSTAGTAVFSVTDRVNNLLD